MWKVLLGLCLFLCYTQEKIGIYCTRFGHEPGAYNVPNLIPYESSEMTYSPTHDYQPANRWYSRYGLNTELVNDSNICYSGDTCLKVFGRLSYPVYYRASCDLLDAGSTYLFNVFVKLTNSSHDLVTIHSFSRSWYKNSSLGAVYRYYVKTKLKVEDRWIFISMEAPVTEQDKENFESFDFYLSISNSTYYILDAASLTKVDYPGWKAEAVNNIANYRMGDIKLRINSSSGLDPSKITVQVNQTRRHYPFGLAVSAGMIGGNDSDPEVQRYRDWVEKRATWAVFLNAAKWKSMERYAPDYTDEKFEKADRAYAWLKSKNIKVRGHTVHWNGLSHIPEWVAESSNKTAEINRRTNYVVEHFKGRFQHWDVINEFTNTRLYQEWLGREDVLEYLHSEVQRIDPDVKKFTNEWGALDSHYHFADSVNAILRLKERNLIDGIGLQGHLSPVGNKLDMGLIKRRLEIFTGLGIPVWITELTIGHDDPVIRGELLADCLTLFYSTPGVHGIIQWDFNPTLAGLLDTALAWPNTTNNAAGDKYDETLSSWSTNLVLGPPSSQTANLLTRAFYGKYDIQVFYDGIKKAELTDVELTPEQNPLTLDCQFRISASLSVSESQNV